MIDPQFKIDVEAGLSARPKYLKSKYFYDDMGSELFRQIMDLPEYYLTRAELEIFKSKSHEIISAIGAKEFNIIELGAGDGFKTRELLRAVENENIKTNFYPIDISKEALNKLQQNLSGFYPEQNVELHHGDYFLELEKVYSSEVMEVVLFLGSNIGNYSAEEAVELLKLIGDKIKKGDLLILGVDLKKDPRIISKAYNDQQGITRQFNLNLLERMNTELEADFKLEGFDFYSFYNPETGEVKSYLISLEKQMVIIEALDQTYSFNENELVYTELSKKYALEDIEQLALKAGFRLRDEIHDSKEYFAECILEKV
jgi:dimethylhistidine N-methyltransferase